MGEPVGRWHASLPPAPCARQWQSPVKLAARLRAAAHEEAPPSGHLKPESNKAAAAKQTGNEQRLERKVDAEVDREEEKPRRDDRDDMPSLLGRIEPKRRVLEADLRALAVYFAKVGFNTGLLIRQPQSAILSERLDHERIRCLVKKYDLKMNLDKRFVWISHPEPGHKLRIFHVALTYFETFVQEAARTQPLDFNEQHFWRCAHNEDYWRTCRREMKRLNGRQKHEVRFKHSSSRLLSVAILPLLNKEEPILRTIWALSVELRKGTPDMDRFRHFRRECWRHSDADQLGCHFPEKKRELRAKFAIAEAERQLKPINVARFFELWNNKGAILSCNRMPDDKVACKPGSVCLQHIQQVEPDGEARERDLELLARFFCRLGALEQLQQHDHTSDSSTSMEAKQVRALIEKYSLLCRPLINQFSVKEWTHLRRVRFDGLARDHLELFVECASEALEEPHQLEGEEQFWRCANNFAFWRRERKAAARCTERKRRCELAPGRLFGCGFYRLLTRQEPKLVELYALRAPPEQYNYVKHNILYQLDRPLEPAESELKRRLRARFLVEEAERKLKPVERALFFKLHQLDQNTCFKETIVASDLHQDKHSPEADSSRDEVAQVDLKDNLQIESQDEVQDVVASRETVTIPEVIESQVDLEASDLSPSDEIIANQSEATKCQDKSEVTVTKDIEARPKEDEMRPPAASVRLARRPLYLLAEYLKKIEPHEQKLVLELRQLASHFNRPSSVFLLDDHNLRIRALLNKPNWQTSDEVPLAYKLAYKYHIYYSRICHSLAPTESYLVRLHRLVSDHVQLFMDQAVRDARLTCDQPEERRFWWCANNLDFMTRYANRIRNVDAEHLLCRLAPSRLVSIAVYRLVSDSEPKLMALAALRAACERQDRKIKDYHYESLTRTIEYVNEKLDLAQRELIQKLRLRYDLEGAERELGPVDTDLFIERWNSNATPLNSA